MKQRVRKIRQLAILVLVLSLLPFALVQDKAGEIGREKGACTTGFIFSGVSRERVDQYCDEKAGSNPYKPYLFGFLGTSVGLFVLAWVLDDESEDHKQRGRIGTYGGGRPEQITFGGENRRMGRDKDQ